MGHRKNGPLLTILLGPFPLSIVFGSRSIRIDNKRSTCCLLTVSITVDKMVQRVAAIDLAAVHCAAAVAATLTPFLLADGAVIADTPSITQPSAAQISAGAVTSGLPPCAAGVLPRSSSPKTVPADGFFCTTPTQRANAPVLEAGLEGILRDQKRCVKRSWFFLFRVQGVHTRDIFCGLDDRDSGFRTVCEEGFGVDTYKGFTHRVGVSNPALPGQPLLLIGKQQQESTRSRMSKVSRSSCLPLIHTASSINSWRNVTCTSMTNSSSLNPTVRGWRKKKADGQRLDPMSYPYKKKIAKRRSDQRLPDSWACTWIPR